MPEITPLTKVSEITVGYLASYLHIDSPDEGQQKELATMLSSAKGYVSSYTGLPLTAPTDDAETTDVDESDVDTVDDNPEFVTAVCVLVQNAYDNRTLYVDKGEAERVVNSILGMHERNLL